MKKYILILLLFLSGSSFSQTYLDSIPTVDNFGRVRNGIIVDGIVSVLNTDPSGVKLTEPELAYIRSIVGGLYLAGSWQKMKAIFGFVGGNAWKHKWNWKDMRDLDEAFRLVFNGTFSHNINGLLPTSPVSYAQTFLKPSIDLSINSIHLSLYSHTNYIGAVFDVGSDNLNPTRRVRLGLFNNNQIVSEIGNNSVNFFTNNSKGFALSSRINSSEVFLLKDNDLRLFSNTSISITSANLILFGDYNFSSGTFDSTNRPMQFVSIGSGLTGQQAIKTSNIVTYSQGILNRQ